MCRDLWASIVLAKVAGCGMTRGIEVRHDAEQDEHVLGGADGPVAGGVQPAPRRAAEQNKVEMQGETRTMASTTLAKLYSTQPKAKAAVEGSAGYAVFQQFWDEDFCGRRGQRRRAGDEQQDQERDIHADGGDPGGPGDGG